SEQQDGRSVRRARREVWQPHNYVPSPMNFSVEFVPGSWDGDTFIEPKLIIKALDGTFEQAKPKIEKILADFGLAGIQIEMETPIEKHTHGPETLAQRVQKHA